MSMVDSVLMKALLNAVRPGTYLIMIGDVDQLPSVGAGNVLFDLIASERIRTVILKEIFRQSGVQHLQPRIPHHYGYLQG